MILLTFFNNLRKWTINTWYENCLCSIWNFNKIISTKNYVTKIHERHLRSINTIHESRAYTYEISKITRCPKFTWIETNSNKDLGYFKYSYSLMDLFLLCLAFYKIVMWAIVQSFSSLDYSSFFPHARIVCTY